MKSLIAALALSTALVAPGLAMARPVTLTVNMAQYGGPGAYVAIYVTDTSGAYAGSLWMAGGKSKYYKHLTDWASLPGVTSRRWTGSPVRVSARGEALS